jgi:hypothetical protein
MFLDIYALKKQLFRYILSTLGVLCCFRPAGEFTIEFKINSDGTNIKENFE